MDKTGHYAAAERYLRMVENDEGGYGYTGEMNHNRRMKWLAMAQVHATLATVTTDDKEN